MIPRPPSSPGSFQRLRVSLKPPKPVPPHSVLRGAWLLGPQPRSLGAHLKQSAGTWGSHTLPETWAASALPRAGSVVGQGGLGRLLFTKLHERTETHTHLPSLQERNVRQLENTHSHHRPKGRAGGPRLFPGGCAPTDGRDAQAADKSQWIRLLSAPILDLLDPQTLPRLVADVQLQLPVDSPGTRL